uniref:AAA+ ATPase domain-containing protein n=1 Tax=Globodera rostochiensis TaxID=31243 RepID=A0A914H347_GLORO
MSSSDFNLSSAIIKTIGACASAAIAAFILSRALERIMDPNYEAQKNAKKKVIELMKVLKLDPDKCSLNSYETRIAAMISLPDEGIDIDEIGGCAAILDQLQENVIFPLRLMAAKVIVPSSLYTPPKGVLLHGPPGCGKTLIARAIAKKVDAFFINFDIAVLNDMFYGETAKLTKALFTFSEKVQPCVIFIDEIDSVLRTRQDFDHEVSAIMKTQFMALWDGFLNSDSTVIVIGATNRPQDVDEAIMRRLPLRMHVPKPDLAAREHILRVILRKQNLENDFNFAKIAQETNSLSGSDLKEVVRLACLSRYRSVIQDLVGNNPSEQQLQEQRIAEITLSHDDVIRTLNDFKIRTMETIAANFISLD